MDLNNENENIAVPSTSNANSRRPFSSIENLQQQNDSFLGRPLSPNELFGRQSTSIH